MALPLKWLVSYTFCWREEFLAYSMIGIDLNCAAYLLAMQWLDLECVLDQMIERIENSMRYVHVW
jgi:hypothetical protein